MRLAMMLAASEVPPSMELAFGLINTGLRAFFVRKRLTVPT